MPTTINDAHKNVRNIRKKNYIDRQRPGTVKDSQAICATIPSAVDFRDRCHSDGNLLLVFPTNIDKHQATIVSLPASTDVELKGKYYHVTKFVFFYKFFQLFPKSVVLLLFNTICRYFLC